MITVKIKRLSSTTNETPIPLPARMSADAAGFDLPADVHEPLVINPGEIKLVPCGFALAIPNGYEGQVRPRSGLAARHGVTVINSPGTIDSDYRGEVKVALVNHGLDPFTIERGTRIAQLLILPVPSVQIVEVDDLDETHRGEGGFGHTGR